MAARFKMGGRELALIFNVEAMDEIEERLGLKIDLSNLQKDLVHGLNDRHVLVAVAAIMMREGMIVKGIDPDIDETWVKRNMKPGRQLGLHAAVLEGITLGMSMENAADNDDDAEVDVVLEELKKKQGQTG